MKKLTPEEHRRLGHTSPQVARNRLEGMGFEDHMWGRILSSGLGADKFGSHETRALITIAKGDEPRPLGRSSPGNKRSG